MTSLKIKDKNLGIIYIMGAAFCFALMNLFVQLSGDVPLLQKCFFRNGVAMIITAVLLLKSKEKFKFDHHNIGPLFGRALFGTIGLICNFYAIDHLNSISDASLLNKLSPFFAIIFSYFILKEKANKYDWISVLVAFAGALLIIKPSPGLNSFPAIIGAISGLGAGMAYTFVRMLGNRKERGLIIVMFFATSSSLAMLPLIAINYSPMSWWQLGYLMLAGIAATGGQFFITAAYRKAPAKDISVFDYTQVLFAALLGFLFLGQLPDHLSIAGYIIIIGVAFARWEYSRKSVHA